MPDYVKLRRFSKSFKREFMRRRDNVRAGDSSKDRRNGPDMRSYKAHLGTENPNLGELMALDRLADRVRSISLARALRKIFG